jgi:hypothetical protein
MNKSRSGMNIQVYVKCQSIATNWTLRICRSNSTILISAFVLPKHGWANLWIPQSVLCHQEFGSRLIGSRPDKTYRKERRYFLERWRHVVRDDPYFHPSLSLFSFRPALA